MNEAQREIIERNRVSQARQNQNALEKLEALEAKGKLRPAEKVVLERLRARKALDDTTVDETAARYRGMRDGLTFNFDDEVVGLFGGDQQAHLARDAALRELYPSQYDQGEMAGAVTSGVGIAPLWSPFLKGAGSLWGLMGRTAIAGGVEGTAYGAGKQQDDGRLANATRGGLLGLAIGGAAPPVAAGLSKGVRAGFDLIQGGVDAVAGRGSPNRAARAVGQAVERSGKTTEQIAQEIAQARLEGQGEYRLMDALGISGQRLASGVARSGDDGAREIARFLEDRQSGQGERVAGAIEDAFGFRANSQAQGTEIVPDGYVFADTPSDVLRGAQVSAAQTTEALKKARGAQADEAYSAAREGAGAVDVRGALGVIDARIGGMQGSGVKGDSIDGRLAGFRDRLLADPGPDGVRRELSDFDRVLGVKQDVQDAIGAAVKAGRDNEARELGKLSAELDKALEASSPNYRAANDQFREASRVIDAVDEGAAMSRPGARYPDTTQRFAAMTPDQQAAARIGYGDKALEKIEANASPTADRSKPFRTPKVQAEIGAMAQNPGLLSRFISREGDMWSTQNRALGGSRTADNLQDIENTGVIGNIGRAVRDTGNVSFGDAAVSLVTAATNAAKGQNEATRKIIARALMANDPSAILAQVKDAGKREQLQRMLIAAGWRGLARPALD